MDWFDEEEEEEDGLQLPLARVKKIIKGDPDLAKCSNDGVVLIGKATV